MFNYSLEQSLHSTSCIEGFVYYNTKVIMAKCIHSVAFYSVLQRLNCSHGNPSMCIAANENCIFLKAANVSAVADDLPILVSYIRECGSFLYLGMAKEILNLPRLCISRIMAKEGTNPIQAILHP